MCSNKRYLEIKRHYLAVGKDNSFWCNVSSIIYTRAMKNKVGAKAVVSLYRGLGYNCLFSRRVAVKIYGKYFLMDSNLCPCRKQFTNAANWKAVVYNHGQ